MEKDVYSDMLKIKLDMDTALVAGAHNKSSTMLRGLENSYNLYLGLKLPDLAAKTTIGNNSAEITKESLEEMRALLETAKKAQQPNS